LKPIKREQKNDEYSGKRQFSLLHHVVLKPVVFNVCEIAPKGRFQAFGGDIVIYEIWGAISVSRGAISAG